MTIVTVAATLVTIIMTLGPNIAKHDNV